MTRVLITGGAGFIGWHLEQFYKGKDDYEVKSIDNFFHPCSAPSEASYADIRYYDEIEPYVEWADIVFHLAAQIHVDRSIEFPQETVDINVNGTLNILEACKKFKKKLVFASSSEVYGTSQVDFMPETHQLDGQSPYAASKTAGDRLCKAYADTFGLDVVILRNFNTFGEWQNDSSYGSVIAKFTKAALEGSPLYIFGDGQQERDYMHVNNAVLAYDFCSRELGAGTTLNVGSGKTVRILDLASTIKRLTKTKSPIIHVEPRPGEVQRLCADMTKAKDLGFDPSFNFENDLYNYIIWYNSNL